MTEPSPLASGGVIITSATTSLGAEARILRLHLILRNLCHVLYFHHGLDVLYLLVLHLLLDAALYGGCRGIAALGLHLDAVLTALKFNKVAAPIGLCIKIIGGSAGIGDREGKLMAAYGLSIAAADGNI